MVSHPGVAGRHALSRVREGQWRGSEPVHLAVTTALETIQKVNHATRTIVQVSAVSKIIYAWVT